MIEGWVSSEISEQARSTAEEICGVIVADGPRQRVLFGRNIHHAPTEGAVIDRETMRSAYHADRILAVFHSHPKGGPPSELDVKVCSAIGHTMAVYGVPEDRWYFVRPQKQWRRLVGREFDSCLHLVHEYFAECRGISLPPVAGEILDAWPTNTRDLAAEYATKYDFVDVLGADNPREGDVLGFAMLTHNRVNWVAAYLGDGLLLFSTHEQRKASTMQMTAAHRRLLRAHLRHASEMP